MILVDTAVWADHFRARDLVLSALLTEDRILMHPFVIGELALGDLRPWSETVARLQEMPQVTVGSDADFFSFVASERLATTGIGFVDTHLLLSTHQRPGLRLWTRDKRLARMAETLGLGWSEPSP